MIIKPYNLMILYERLNNVIKGKNFFQTTMLEEVLKKILLLIIALITTVNLDAKRFYFDIGLVGSSVETYFHLDDDYPTQQSFRGTGFDFSTRLGYFLSNRFILVAEYQNIIGGDGVYHFKTGVNTEGYPEVSLRETINLVYGGAGFIYYLNPRFQASATLGYSKIYRDLEFEVHVHYPYALDSSSRHGIRISSPGIGFNVSVAYDISWGFIGSLIGEDVPNIPNIPWRNIGSLIGVRFSMQQIQISHSQNGHLKQSLLAYLRKYI